MPTNTSFSSGFGAGTRLGDIRVGQERNQLFRQQQENEQRNQLKAELDEGFQNTLKIVQDNAKQFSAAILAEVDPTKKKLLIDTYDKFIEEINASEEEKDSMAINSQLIGADEARSRAAQLRVSATLTDPVAETKLESGVTQKRDIAVSGAQKVQAATIVPENKKFVNFINPETQDRKSAREGSAEAAQLASSGYLRDVRQEGDVGLTGSQGGKVLGDIAEERIVAENFDDSLSQIQDFVKSENYVGGVTGTGLQLINSAAQQFAQLTGTETLFNGTELNINHLAEDLSNENIGFLRRAAISGDVREAAKARLAYILAKQLDPNGRISNADVENAENILSGSADRQSTLLTLQNLRNTSEREFNTRARIMEQTLKNTADPFRPLGKTKGTGSKKDVSEMTDAELFQ